MKNKRILPIFVALLTITNMVPMTLAAGQGSLNPPNMPMELPPIPEGGQMNRVNLTDLVPTNYKQNLTAGESTLLRFSNMVMELNCSRNMTMNITSDEGVRIQYMALRIQTEQNMHLELHARAEPPEGIPGPEFGINQYMQFETNNTGLFNASLRLYLNATELDMKTSREMNMSHMTWCYWNGSDWEPVMSMLTESGFLEANTTHFSIWTIMEQMVVGKPTETTGEKERVRTLSFLDVVPQDFRHTAESHQATMLQFKNTELYVNCTNRLQLKVSAENQYTQKTLSLEIDPGKSLNLQIQLRKSKPVDVSVPEKHIGFYCEIEPNTTITHARIGLEIDPSQVQEMNMEMEKLSWAYWNGADWELVNSALSDDNILEADTDHFSTWTILQVEETTAEPEPSTTEPSTGIPIPPMFIVVGVVTAVLFTVKKKPTGISS